MPVFRDSSSTDCAYLDKSETSSKISRIQRGQNLGGHMKFESSLYFSMCLLAALVVPLAAAQDTQQQRKPPAVQYTITDLGTLPGGNFSQPFFINKNGVVSGSASLADGTQNAILWLNGQMNDIGAPGLGGPNSIAFVDNENSQAVGEAETSTSDPNGEDFCGFGTHLICLPFLWQGAKMIPLPTLGGNNGVAEAINNRAEVARPRLSNSASSPV